MAVKKVNECVGCPPELGCLGEACPNRNVLVFTCDDCGEEFGAEELYEYEYDRMLCAECLLKIFPKISHV